MGPSQDTSSPDCAPDEREAAAVEELLRAIRWSVGEVSVATLPPGHVWQLDIQGPQFAYLSAGSASLRAGEDPGVVARPRGADTRLGETSLDAGDFLLLPRRGAVRIRADGDTAVRFVTGSLTMEGGAFHQVTELMPAAVFSCRWILQSTRLDGLVGVLDAELRRQDHGGSAVLDRVVDLVVSSALRSWLERRCVSATAWLVQLRDPRLGHALEAMHSDPGSSWTVESLARLAHTSRSQFAEVFHDLMGESPARYLTTVRMRRAEQFLRAGWSVSRIAVELGYASDEGFRRAFRRHCGLTPTQWRREEGSTAEGTGSGVQVLPTVDPVPQAAAS